MLRYCNFMQQPWIPAFILQMSFLGKDLYLLNESFLKMQAIVYRIYVLPVRIWWWRERESWMKLEINFIMGVGRVVMHRYASRHILCQHYFSGLFHVLEMYTCISERDYYKWLGMHQLLAVWPDCWTRTKKQCLHIAEWLVKGKCILVSLVPFFARFNHHWLGMMIS